MKGYLVSLQQVSPGDCVVTWSKIKLKETRGFPSLLISSYANLHCPTLPYSTLANPALLYPILFIISYLTLSYPTLPCPMLPYPTQIKPIRSNLSRSYPFLPYTTQSYPTLYYPILP